MTLRRYTVEFSAVITAASAQEAAAEALATLRSPETDTDVLDVTREEMMTYELIGTPEVQREYCDKWETALVFTLRRSDGVEGTIWVMAGVPDYYQGSSKAARHRMGFEVVRPFGQSLSEWCDDNFLPGDDDDSDEWRVNEMDQMMAAVRDVALANQIDYDAADADDADDEDEPDIEDTETDSDINEPDELADEADALCTDVRCGLPSDHSGPCEEEAEEKTIDPNANLREQLELAQKIADNEETDEYLDERLAELVLGLNKWIGNGGALPDAWRR